MDFVSQRFFERKGWHRLCLAFYDRLLNPATRLPSLYHSAIFREGMFVEIETWSVFYFVPVNSYSIARELINKLYREKYLIGIARLQKYYNLDL